MQEKCIYEEKYLGLRPKITWLAFIADDGMTGFG
jgi:hypothetical protein